MSPKNQQDGGAPERVWIRFTLAGIHATLSNSEKYGEQSIPYVPASALDQAMALARAEAFEDAAEECHTVDSSDSSHATSESIKEWILLRAKAARERGGKVT